MCVFMGWETGEGYPSPLLKRRPDGEDSQSQQRFQTVAYTYQASISDHLIEHPYPRYYFGTFRVSMQKEAHITRHYAIQCCLLASRYISRLSLIIFCIYVQIVNQVWRRRMSRASAASESSSALRGTLKRHFPQSRHTEPQPIFKVLSPARSPRALSYRRGQRPRAADAHPATG